MASQEFWNANYSSSFLLQIFKFFFVSEVGTMRSKISFFPLPHVYLNMTSNFLIKVLIFMFAIHYATFVMEQ